jgi:hypothetical protein
MQAELNALLAAPGSVELLRGFARIGPGGCPSRPSRDRQRLYTRSLFAALLSLLPHEANLRNVSIITVRSGHATTRMIAKDRLLVPPGRRDSQLQRVPLN